MNPPPVLDTNGQPYPERRETPGRRVTDIEHEVVATSLEAVKKARKAWAVIASIAAAVSSAGTALLLLFGLRIGGAADVSSLRASSMRADSVLEAQNTRQDSIIAANRRAIEELKQRDKMKMIVLCVIADKVHASTGGYCAPYLNGDGS